VGEACLGFRYEYLLQIDLKVFGVVFGVLAVPAKQ
jgi:hypothetical protein